MKRLLFILCLIVNCQWSFINCAVAQLHNAPVDLSGDKLRVITD